MSSGESRSDTFAATPPLKFVRLISSWAASYKPKLANASMIIAVFHISVSFFHGKVRKVIYVVPPEDLRKKGKIWRLLKSLYGTRDASQVFAAYVEEGLYDHGLQRNAVVPCLYWGAMPETLGVHWGDDFIFGIPDDTAGDLEQLMREVKVCATVPTVWMNKKHNNTYHWLAQHCMLDKTDQKHNMQRKKQRDSCLIPRVLRSVCSTFVQVLQRSTRTQLEFSMSRNAK